MDPADAATQPSETELDAASAAAAEAIAEPGTEEATAPATDPADEIGAGFRLEDVPEEYREHVERYAKQVHGGFTRKTQELADQRREAEAALALQKRLSDDATRMDALRELAAEHGIELEFDDDGEVVDATATDGADGDETAKRIAALERAEAQRAADAEQRDREDYIAEVSDRIEEGLSGLAEKLGLGEDEAVSDQVRDHVVAIARSIAPIEENGRKYPNMDAAVAQYEAWRAAEIQRYVQSKRVQTPKKDGGPAAPKFNARDDRERLAAANAIAGRHL